MASPILVTKLYIPPTRSEIVQRPALIEYLNNGLDRKLTLVSAPAGFGKTTLLSHWLDQLGENNANLKFRFSWLSLDDEDNDLTRFLTYFVSALNRTQGIETKIGEGALNILKSPQPPPASAILTTIINEITAIPEKIVFVFDDYHLIDNQLVNDAVAFLIENLPPQLQLVIATRQDPHLSLGRLRAQDQVTDLRAADLRFTLTETATFLNQIMGLNLSSEDIAGLETRTEGWIAGLQLAAISLQGSDDRRAFIKSFSGGHRLVLDFLIEEVLGQQPENIRNFLLQTAILNRMTGSLCDALTGQDDGQQTLETLDRANLFIIPLDNERRWYRYHHLFADLLRQRFKQTQSELFPILHSKASQWFEENKFIDKAINHALLADDLERATSLIELHIDDLWSQGENHKLRGWLEKIPVARLKSKPNLCIFHAWYLYLGGQVDKAETILQLAEQAIDTAKFDQAVLKGRIAAVRAFIMASKMDLQSIIQYGHQALEYLPETELNWRSLTTIVSGDAQAYMGDTTAAYETRIEALKAWEAIGNIYWILVANQKLASTLRAKGQLQRTIEICQQQMQVVNEFGLSQTRAICWLLALWGETLAEINDLETATQLKEQIIELTRHNQDPAMISWNCICLMRISFSKGDISGAIDTIQEMEKWALESKVQPFYRDLISVWQTRIWLVQDNMEAATQWAHEHEKNIDGGIPFLREIENIVLARVYIAQGRLDEAIDLLQHLRESAEMGGRISKAIEIMILQSLSYQARDETDQAVSVLEKALCLAKPEGFIRIFVDEGPPMARLLYKALENGISPEYVQRLLAAFPVAESGEDTSTKGPVDQSGLIDPLSEREIEVLQMIANGLTNQEISDRLFLSVHTVKTHTRNIYGKLGAHHRTEAVVKAKAFGIL